MYKDRRKVHNITGVTCGLRHFSAHHCSATLDGSVRVLFFSSFVEATFVQSNTTQVYFNPLSCPHTHAKHFGLYLGRPQACQYREHIRTCSSYCMHVLCVVISVDRDSSLGTAIRYRLEGPGIEFRWGAGLPVPSRPTLERTQPRIQRVPGLSRG